MNQARQVTIRATGSPEVMEIVTRALDEPAAHEVQLRQIAIGFNYIDIYQRRGVYPLDLPSGLGHEAAGVITAVGKAVSGFVVGDRVAYMNAGIGAYADARNLASERLVRIPDTVSDEQAAALLFKGLTAQYLLRKTYRVKPGDLVLVHAAAGGVGQILCQWAKGLGAIVVGTAGSPEKCQHARLAGADIAVDYSRDDWVKALMEATDGRKADVVYDSVGQATFLDSLDCAAPFGTVVIFGAASGPAPLIDPEILNRKGCLFLTRPSVFPHNADPASLRANAAELFDAVDKGWIKSEIDIRFSLGDVVEAHRAAEARQTLGSVVMHT